MVKDIKYDSDIEFFKAHIPEELLDKIKSKFLTNNLNDKSKKSQMEKYSKKLKKYILSNIRELKELNKLRNLKNNVYHDFSLDLFPDITFNKIFIWNKEVIDIEGLGRILYGEKFKKDDWFEKESSDIYDKMNLRKDDMAFKKLSDFLNNKINDHNCSIVDIEKKIFKSIIDKMETRINNTKK